MSEGKNAALRALQLNDISHEIIQAAGRVRPAEHDCQIKIVSEIPFEYLGEGL